MCCIDFIKFDFAFALRVATTARVDALLGAIVLRCVLDSRFVFVCIGLRLAKDGGACSVAVSRTSSRGLAGEQFEILCACVMNESGCVLLRSLFGWLRCLCLMHVCLAC